MRVEKIAVEKVHCRYCFAIPKEKCRTNSGAQAPVHMVRWEAARSEFFEPGDDGWRLRLEVVS